MNKNYVSTMKVITYGILLFALFGFVYFTESSAFERNDKSIRDAIAAMDEKVVSIDRHFFNVGPYWPDKNTRFYKVVTDKNTYWFQFRPIFSDQVYLENHTGSYIKVK